MHNRRITISVEVYSSRPANIKVQCRTNSQSVLRRLTRNTTTARSTTSSPITHVLIFFIISVFFFFVFFFSRPSRGSPLAIYEITEHVHAWFTSNRIHTKNHPIELCTEPSTFYSVEIPVSHL